MSIDPPPPDLPGPAVPGVASHLNAPPAGAHDHHQPIHELCQNCREELKGPYCHRCGQHDFDVHRSFGHAFLEALENFFHFDEKFFRNVITLLFQPGRLSADFNAGKRAAQMPPFRLYLFISFLFFFISFLGSHSSDEVNLTSVIPAAGQADSAQWKLKEAIQEIAGETTDPGTKQRLQVIARGLKDSKEPHAPSAEELKEIPPDLGKLISGNDAVADKSKVELKPKTDLEQYLTEKGNYAFTHQVEFKEAFLHALPRMLFVCLPLMALYARVLFRGTGYVYLQHFIVALHYHTFVYLWWLVSRGWSELVGLRFSGLASFVGFFAGLWMFLYPFFMFRQLFNQPWGRTIFKTVILATAYSLTLALGFLVTAIFVFMSV